MKKNNKKSNNRIADLEQEISRLTNEIIGEKQWNQILQDNCDEAEKQRRNYRELLKYHTLIMIIFNLLHNYTHSSDIGKAIQINVNKYYKGLAESIMALPTYIEDNDNDDDEEDGEEEL